MKKRIFAGVMAFLLMFTLISPVEAKAEENYGVSITLPEGADIIELTNEAPTVYLEGITMEILGCEEEIAFAIANFESDYSYTNIWFSAEEDGLVGELEIDSYWEGTNLLTSVEICTVEDEWITIETNLPDVSITVVNNITDFDGPVVSDVQIETSADALVQGQGATVTVSANVVDEGMGILEGSVEVWLVSANDEMISMTMEDQGDGTYVAVFSIDGDEYYDALSNCDWTVDSISAYDVVGNYVDYYLEDDGKYVYFDVEDADGYCDRTRYDVEIYFLNESYDTIAEYVVDSPDRVTTLEELLGEVPVYETEFGFEGWKYDVEDMVLQNDTEFVIPYSGYVIYLYPETTVDTVEVGTVYINEELEVTMSDYESYALSSDTTYADLLEMIPEAESVDGCNFLGWEYMDSEVDLTEEVDTDIIDVYAVYDNYPVNITRLYIDESGEAVYDENTQIYPAGTMMDDIYAEWADKDIDGAEEIVDWQNIFVDEEISVNNNQLVMFAQYEEKMVVVLEITYLEDGGEYGSLKIEEFYAVFDKDTYSEDAVIQYLTNELGAEMNHYCTFAEGDWVIEASDMNEDGYDDVLVCIPNYNNIEEKPAVVLIGEEMRIYFVEPGQVISLPTVIDGYNVTWADIDGNEFTDTYTVPEDVVEIGGVMLYPILGEKVENPVDPEEETHNLVHVEAIEPGCHNEGCIEHWYCLDCDTVWQDEALTQLTNHKNVIIPAVGGEVIHMEAIEPGCHSLGNIEYWYCVECEQVWQDEALTQLTNQKRVILPELGSENVKHVAAKAPTATENGNVEYWYCADCDSYYTDEACTQLSNAKRVILPATGEIEAPKTGDNTPVALMVTFLLASVVLVAYGYKRRNV